jgi:hypothetical protein
MKMKYLKLFENIEDERTIIDRIKNDVLEVAKADPYRSVYEFLTVMLYDEKNDFFDSDATETLYYDKLDLAGSVIF